MSRANPALLALLLASGCSAPPVPPLFDSRVPLEPLLAKLKESGGDPGRILRPRATADLGRLESGRRYKFVVARDGQLAIAPLPADDPSNEYVHPVLAGGAPVRTAGGIRVERDGSAIRKVAVDQDSNAYCPTAASPSGRRAVSASTATARRYARRRWTRTARPTAPPQPAWTRP